MIRSFLLGLQDLVYPPLCIQCRHQRLESRIFTGLCPDCTRRIPLNKPPFCIRCNRHQSEAYPRPLCRNCRSYAMDFDFALGACLYTPYVRQLIHRYKFQQKTYLRHAFVQRMQDYIRHYNLDLEQFDAFVPMPLSAVRLRERGYNQAALLAELLAREYDKPLWLNYLLKNRHTPSQTSVARKERFTNVKGAFRINPSSEIVRPNILIIDDLLTTGATAAAAARAVKKSQAGTVAILALAIA